MRPIIKFQSITSNTKNYFISGVIQIPEKHFPRPSQQMFVILLSIFSNLFTTTTTNMVTLQFTVYSFSVNFYLILSTFIKRKATVFCYLIIQLYNLTNNCVKNQLHIWHTLVFSTILKKTHYQKSFKKTLKPICLIQQ